MSVTTLSFSNLVRKLIYEEVRQKEAAHRRSSVPLRRQEEGQAAFEEAARTAR
jgi:hypothetical protein